jgi:hypothetical protein
MVVDLKSEKTKKKIILLLSYATLYTPNSPDNVLTLRSQQRGLSMLLNIYYLKLLQI